MAAQHLISTVHHAADLAFVNGTGSGSGRRPRQSCVPSEFRNRRDCHVALGWRSAGAGESHALSVSRDQRRVYVANGGSAEIVAIDLSNGVTARYACPCSPSAVRRLNGTAVFRLTEPSDGPLWLFDGDLAQPRIMFVPASKAKQ